MTTLSLLFGDLSTLASASTSFSEKATQLSAAAEIMPAHVPATALQGTVVAGIDELLAAVKAAMRQSADALHEGARVVHSLKDQLESYDHQFKQRRAREGIELNPIDLIGTALFGEPEYVAGRWEIERAQSTLRHLSYKASLSRSGGYTVPGEGEDPNWVDETFAKGAVGQFFGGMAGGATSAVTGTWDAVTNPVQTLQGMAALGQSLVDDPEGTVEAILDLEGFHENPARWLGGAAFAVGISVITAGAGAAVKGGSVAKSASGAVAKAARPSSVTIPEGGLLLTHRSAGGHVFERHVGKSDQWLLDRAMNHPRMRGSSTFDTADNAERFILIGLDRQVTEIAAWKEAAREGRGDRQLDFVVEIGETTGRGYPRGSTSLTDIAYTTKVHLTLKYDESMPDGYIIWSAYPEL